MEGPAHVLPALIELMLRLLVFAITLYFMYRYLWPFFKRRLAESRTRRRYTQPSEGRMSSNANQSIHQRIDLLLFKYVDKGLLRQGLFALSETMKEHYTNKSGINIHQMTAAEIAEQYRTKQPALFFHDLEHAMYAPRAIGDSRYEELFESAHKTIRSRPRLKHKRSEGTTT